MCCAGISMSVKRFLWIIVAAMSVDMGIAYAGDLTIALPKRSHGTPVQSLNRDGVEALRKNQYRKAEAAFFKAYLLDPEDPFTLNNLGYVSELQGDAEKAQRFYSLAAQQANNATVGMASARQLEGQPFQVAVTAVRSTAMQINRDNFEAIYLFSQKRAVEADSLLQRTLQLDQSNAFTLNNLGVAKELEGDFDGALRDYSAAANVPDAKQTAILTSDNGPSGRSIRQVASDNVQRLRGRLKEADTAEKRAALLNFRGVAAVNRNEPREAAKDFLQAYQADPNSAFSLNNAGYVAEMDGDLETAQSFYESARHAADANAPVGLATRTSAEGMSLAKVADDSGQTVAAKIGQQQDAKRRETGPIRLKRRDGQPVTPDAQPAPQAPPSGRDQTNPRPAVPN